MRPGDRCTVPKMGGVEVELTSLWGESAFVRLPGVGNIMLPTAALKPIAAPPALPPEPPNGVVRAGAKVARRVDHISGDPDRTCRWWLTGHVAPVEWADVCRYGPPTRLVPDPFGEPVELPYGVVTTGGAYPGGGERTGARIKIELGQCAGSVGLRVGVGYSAALTPDNARDIARALWAAANQAAALTEQASQ